MKNTVISFQLSRLLSLPQPDDVNIKNDVGHLRPVCDGACSPYLKSHNGRPGRGHPRGDSAHHMILTIF